MRLGPHGPFLFFAQINGGYCLVREIYSLYYEVDGYILAIYFIFLARSVVK